MYIQVFTKQKILISIEYLRDIVYSKYVHTRLGTHENPVLKTLLLREENRRLERNWSIDLI
jgi:hypothetical protein